MPPLARGSRVVLLVCAVSSHAIGQRVSSLYPLLLDTKICVSPARAPPVRGPTESISHTSTSQEHFVQLSHNLYYDTKDLPPPNTESLCWLSCFELCMVPFLASSHLGSDMSPQKNEPPSPLPQQMEQGAVPGDERHITGTR